MATKSIVLPPPYTVSKNIPQPQAQAPERNYPYKNSNTTRLELFVKDHKSEKSHGHEDQFVSKVNTKKDLRDLDVKYYPDLFIVQYRTFYHACFRFIADNN